MVKVWGTISLVALAASGCALLGWGNGTEIDASFAAGAVLDYVSAEGFEQSQELEIAADTYNLQVAPAQGSQSVAVARTVTTDEIVREYPNVTVTITRSLDDMDTPDDKTDDVLTVTRSADYGFDAPYVQVLVRPLRPEAPGSEWDSFDGGTSGWLVAPIDEITQTGTIDRSLGDVTVADGSVQATWMWSGSSVYAGKIVRELSDLVRPNIAHRTIITQDDAGDTSLTRERVVDGEVVRLATVESWVDPDDGLTYRRIVDEDGGYAVVRAQGNRAGTPRVVDYYSSDGTRFLQVSETRSGARGTMTSTRTFYDADGTILDTRIVEYALRYHEGDEDQVEITRSVNGRSRTVTITESGEVYLATVRGVEYRVRVIDANTVEFLDSSGSVYMTAVRNADGSWSITTPDGVVTV